MTSIDEELVETRAKARMTEVKLNALIKLLAKEGLVVESDIESEVKNIVEAD